MSMQSKEIIAEKAWGKICDLTSAGNGRTEDFIRIIQSAMNSVHECHDCTCIEGQKQREATNEVTDENIELDRQLASAQVGMESYIKELRRCVRELVVNSQNGVRDHDLEIHGVELAEKPLKQ